MWAPVAWWIFWRVMLADWLPTIPRADAHKMTKKD